jgi:outer membrane protein assembly factor BamD (BamD/ComL family)
MTAATCRKVQGAFARDRLEPQLAALMSHHLRDCADCRAQDRRRGQIADAILAADGTLDDLTRTQVLVRLLEAQRRQRASGATAERARDRTWIGWALAVSAAAVLLIAVVPRPARQPPQGTPRLQPLTLGPYAVRSSADASAGLSGRGTDRVELSAGASMRARLGRAADLTLLGPLELAVRNADEQVVVLELKRGTLIGDLDGSAGRRLHIATPDAAVDIVGTRFLVEVVSGRTRVSVEHGRVRVESRGQVHVLDARQEWTTDRADAEPLGARRAALFERAAHGALEALAPDSSDATVRRPAPTPSRAERRASPARAVAFSEDAAPAAPAESSRAVRPELPRATAPALRPAPPKTSVAAAAPAVARTAVPAPQKPREETSASLYRGAETALRQGDDVAAKRLLDQLVRTFPDDPMTDSARYELALMAEKAGNVNEARAQTREILRPGAQGPFVDPARFLRCRITLAEDKAAATLCLTRFVSDFPQSPHDEVALRALIDLAREGRRCADARQFAETYLQRHPHGRFTTEAERARSQCED